MAEDNGKKLAVLDERLKNFVETTFPAFEKIVEKGFSDGSIEMGKLWKAIPSTGKTVKLIFSVLASIVGVVGIILFIVAALVGKI